MTTFNPLNPRASQRPSIGKRLATVLVVGFLLALLIGSLIWSVRLNSPSSSARAPAPAASNVGRGDAPDLEELQALAADTAAPAVRSSAPAARAPTSAASAQQSQASQPAAAAPTSRTYTVQQDDVLSLVFPKDWEQVCKISHLRDCNRLIVGDKLLLPEGVEPRERKAKALKLEAKREVPQAAKPKAARKAPTPRATKPAVVREQSCINLGAAPFNKYGSMKLRLQGIDWNPALSPTEKEEAKRLIQTSKGDHLMVTSDMTFQAMPFRSKSGQVNFIRNVKVCTPEQGGRPEAIAAWKLSTGTWVADPLSCGNIGPVLMPPREEPPPLKKEEPPVTVVTPSDMPPSAPPVQEQPPPASVPPPKVAKPKGVCDHVDPAASLGQEYTLPHDDGAQDDSTFGTASAYCLNRLPTDDGSHGFGGKITASMSDGLISGGRGAFSGWNVLFGPSYKQILDKGIDWEVSLVGGKQVEKYHEKAYASRREFDLAGLTAGLNDYRRRLNGEEWFPEWQVFGALVFPLGKNVSHTIFGQQIADTSDLSRFDFGLQAWFRQWIYESPDWWVHPYFQAGVFVQHPTSASMSLRGGIADPDHIVGFGAGVNCDLKENCKDLVPALGWGADPVKGFRVVRDKVRQRQIVSEAAARGVTMDRATNGFIKSIDIGPPPLK